MKGFSGIIAFVFILLLVVIVFVGTNTTMFWEKGSIKHANVQANLYGMWSALQAADLYINTSIDYSVYQACYDVLRWGGFAQDNKNWSNWNGEEHETPPSEDVFKQNFKELLDKYIKRYTNQQYNFMDNYNVSSVESGHLPDVEISADIGASGISISATAKDKMYITNTNNEFMEKIVLMKGFATQKHYDIPCFNIFLWGEAQHEDVVNKFREVVNEEMKKWPEKNTETYHDKCDANLDNKIFYDAAKDLLISRDDAIKAAEEKIRTDITSEISNYIIMKNRPDSSYFIESEPKITVTIDLNCQAEKTVNGCDYRCTKFKYKILAILKTKIRSSVDKYYPVSSKGYPEFDTMHLVMTDVVSYEK